jgi:tetratricopeptide (TPR) repeat protein
MEQEYDFSDENDNEIFTKSLEKYEEMLRRGKQYYFDHDILFNIIDHYEEINDNEKALDATNYGILLFPFSLELLLKKAQLLIDTEKYDAALKVVAKAQTLEPNDSNVLLMKSDILLLMNKYQQAVEVLKDGLAHSPIESEIYYLELADVYFEWNHFEEAFEFVKKALELNPNNEFALNRIWYLVEVVNKYEESIELHTKILNEFPYNYTAWTNLAQAYTGVGLLEKAFEACEYAIAINENMDIALRDAGELKIMMHQFSEALEFLYKAKDLGLPDAHIYFSIGYCHQKLKEYASARFNYTRSVQISRNFSESYFNIAETYALEKEWKKAIPYYRTAIKMNDQYLPYVNKFAVALLKGELYKDAYKLLTELTENNPRKKSNWKHLIQCQLLMDSPAEALVNANKAISYIGHEDAELLFIIAAVSFINGKIKQAREYLMLACALNCKKYKIIHNYCPVMLTDSLCLQIITKYLGNKK